MVWNVFVSLSHSSSPLSSPSLAPRSTVLLVIGEVVIGVLTELVRCEVDVVKDDPLNVLRSIELVFARDIVRGFEGRVILAAVSPSSHHGWWRKANEYNKRHHAESLTYQISVIFISITFRAEGTYGCEGRTSGR